MLETEEVDVDYFTPAGGSTLASIFSKDSVADDTKENPSLKYIPAPPPEKCKLEDVKPTQWIFTCAVHGFEWSTSGYISRGKLGLAILKVVKTNSHSIILYDSNKTTVSYVAISQKLNIHKRDVLTISYYDNAQIYWSIQTSDDDMNKMLQLLKNLHATIVHKSFQETDREQSDNNKTQNKDHVTVKDEHAHDEEHEIDTDFYMNQKTKDSILKRMANMGHSVLPPHGISKGHTSDSSDSNDIDDGKKSIRHKPAKGISKKSVDLSIQENESNIACHSKKLTHKVHVDGQTVPSKSIATTCGGDMSNFISEQRVNNSEIRMNVNRMSDKIDALYERLNEVVNVDKGNTFSIFQNEIVQKLIKEYESKIKNYENAMSSKGMDFHSVKTQAKTELNENVPDDLAYLNQIDELEKQCTEKNKIIKMMEKEIMVLNENNLKLIESHKEKNNELAKEIETLNKDLNLKNNEINAMKNISEGLIESNQKSCDFANKVKKIMNDTYQAISDNFDDNVTYSGDKIKAIIATVIKKTTMEALQEL